MADEVYDPRARPAYTLVAIPMAVAIVLTFATVLLGFDWPLAALAWK